MAIRSAFEMSPIQLPLDGACIPKMNPGDTAYRTTFASPPTSPIASAKTASGAARRSDKIVLVFTPASLSSFAAQTA